MPGLPAPACVVGGCRDRRQRRIITGECAAKPTRFGPAAPAKRGGEGAEGGLTVVGGIRRQGVAASLSVVRQSTAVLLRGTRDLFGEA
jgi:hypothetical protein